MVEKDTVIKIAHLARLELSEQEIEGLTQDFNAILGHFDQLNSLDTSNVKPMVTSSPITHKPRKDEVLEGIDTDALIKNSPESIGRLFKVPPVV